MAGPSAKATQANEFAFPACENDGLELQPHGSCAERIVLAGVKEEGLNFLDGTGAGRSLKAEEEGAKEQERAGEGIWTEVAAFSCEAAQHVEAMTDAEV